MMKNIYSLKAMKLSLDIKKIITAVVVLSLIANLSAFAAVPFPPNLAQLEENLKQEVSKIPYADCKQKLADIYDVETLKFFNFLEENFQNKSSTSSLSNIAIIKYGEYSDVLKNIFDDLKPKSSSYTNIKIFENELNGYVKCSEMTDAYLKSTKEHMIRYVKNNSSQKKTIILLEKFKAINEGLRKLNMAIAELYSFFATFKNKLPGFLRECL